VRAKPLVRFVRNITAALVHVDPIDIFPGDDQSERRIRFRDNPHVEFLKCGDEEQARIADILEKSLGPDILELCLVVDEDTRRQMGA